MDRKELLIKIADIILEYEGHAELIPEWFALRSVVQRHKPTKMQYAYSGTQYHCKECGGDTPYPCKTMAGILKEFK